MMLPSGSTSSEKKKAQNHDSSPQQAPLNMMISKGGQVGKEAVSKLKELDERYKIRGTAREKVESLDLDAIISKSNQAGKEAISKVKELDDKYKITATAKEKTKSVMHSTGKNNTSMDYIKNMDEKLRVQEKSREVARQIDIVIQEAGKKASHAGSTITGSEAFLSGAKWLSKLLEGMAAYVGKLGSNEKGPTSRKKN